MTSKENQYIHRHGIHFGYLDNAGRGNDIEANEFLKKKTIGSITNYINVGSGDFYKMDQKGQRHYMGMNFTSFYEAMRWAIKTNDNVKWLVLFEAGTVITKPSVLHMWLNQLPPADDTFVGAYAHILTPADMSYFHINTQMVAINVVALRKHRDEIFKVLKFNGTMEINAERSDANYHDDYTPYWVLPHTYLSSPVQTQVNDRSAWAAVLLNKDYTISNFTSDSIRSCKQFFYMDTPEQVALAKAYKNGEDVDKLLEMAEAINKAGVMQSFLELDERAETDGVLVQNTSNFPYYWGLPQMVDAIVTTCAGLNFRRFYKSVPTSDSFRIFHYDISKRAVDLRRKVIMKWDGQNYHDYVKSVIPKGEEYLYMSNYKSEVDGIDQEDWTRITSATHDFIQTDIVKNWKEVLQAVADGGAKSVVFDLTNILSFANTTFNYGYEQPTRQYKEIVDFLRDNFDVWQVYTDQFSFSSSDLAAYDAEDHTIVNVDEVRKGNNSAYGYMVYKAKPIIPIHPVSKVWESASVDFQSLFNCADARRFALVSREAVRSTKAEGWHDFYKSSYLPAVEMDIPFDHEAMAVEAQAIYDKGLFTYHRNDGDSGWASFVINGLGHGMTKSLESYKPGTKETSEHYSITPEAREHAPHIVNFFENDFPRITGGVQAFCRVRIMALEPGGVILPHYDSVNSTEPGPINMAITNPKNCHFHMWRGSNFTPQNYVGIIPYKPGRSFNLDIGNSHCIYNLSDQVRFHIIVHVDWYDDTTRTAMAEFRSKNLMNTIKRFR